MLCLRYKESNHIRHTQPGCGFTSLSAAARGAVTAAVMEDSKWRSASSVWKSIQMLARSRSVNHEFTARMPRRRICFSARTDCVMSRCMLRDLSSWPVQIEHYLRYRRYRSATTATTDNAALPPGARLVTAPKRGGSNQGNRMNQKIIERLHPITLRKVVVSNSRELMCQAGRLARKLYWRSRWKGSPRGLSKEGEANKMMPSG